MAIKLDTKNEHLSTAKNKNLKPFQCTVCDFSTNWNCVLSKQVNEFYDREKTFICDICLNYFGRKDTLNRHQRMVLQKESFGVKGY